MYRIHHTFLALTIALVGALSEAEAQVYYNPSGVGNVVPQQRVIVRTPSRVYSNNGVRYQSFRPSYGQTRVYTNNGYDVQPNRTYPQNGPTYHVQPSTPYYYYPNNQQHYYGNPVYSSQPYTVYGSNYGTGFYSSPQQSANANAGSIIGGVIGGNQGAQVGAAIGARIRP